MTDALIRVLVVDDDSDDFLILQKMFSAMPGHQFELERVMTCDQAMEQLSKGGYDVCLLDYRLEGKSGLDFLRESSQKGLTTPIIFLTGQGDYEVDVEAMRLGASDFLHKDKIDKIILERAIRYAYERKKSLETLRLSEEFFRTLIENALDGVAIVDSGGKARYLSPSIEAILGYSAAERLGMSVFSLIHPNDIARTREIFETLLKEPGKVLSAEFLALHRNGSWRIIEANGQSHLFSNPNYLGVVLNYRDVTERRNAERASMRLATMVEYSHDAIVGCDLEGIINHWNHGAEVLYGYKTEEIIGKPVSVLLPPGHEDENARQIEAVKNGESVHNFESVRKRKGGQLLDVSVSFSPLKDGRGKVVGVSAILRDITERKKTYEMMARLASVVESSEDAIYSLNLDGVILSWNNGARRIYGFSAEEVGGRHVSMLMTRDQETELLELLRKVRTGEAVTGYVAAHQGKRKPLLLSITLSPIKNNLGQVASASVVARDITESERAKAAQEALQVERDQLLERLQLQMEHMPIACVLTDRNFHFTYWNPAAERMFGFSFKEVEGKGTKETIIPSQSEWSRVDQLHDLFRKGTDSVKGEIWEHQRKDGKKILCEWYSTPLKESDETLLGTMGMAIEVTERHKAEEVQAQLGAILQQTTDAVIGADLDGNVFGWNRGAEAMLGYSMTEIVGQPVDRLAPSEKAYESKELFEIVLHGESISNFETVRVHKNGDMIDVSITLSPVKDSKGKIVGVSAILRDITEHKQAQESLRKHEEQLRRVEKMNAIGRLAGGVAHDFNNLLSVIGGNAEFLLSSLSPQDTQREEVEEIQKAVKRGAELTKQLLVFGQKQVSQPQPVNLNELSAEMNKMLKRLIDATVDLSIIQDKNLKPVLGDPGQMQQIILNLVLNAKDAMPKGGHLILETRQLEPDEMEKEGKPTLPLGAYARLSVTDTGTGMTPDVQKHIFEPFFTTKAGKGTGLGLATVYGLVAKWSGHIFVHSTPGMGTTFTLYFPTMLSVEGFEVKPKQIALISQGSETILLAEDEEPVRKVIVRTLEKYGYKVLAAPNGLEAVKKAWDYPDFIHLLLTDTIMPKMNGKELADELKKTRPKIKVVFVSGYPKEVLSQQGILHAGIHLIQKPFELEDLVGQIRKILDEK